MAHLEQHLCGAVCLSRLSVDPEQQVEVVQVQAAGLRACGGEAEPWPQRSRALEGLGQGPGVLRLLQLALGI